MSDPSCLIGYTGFVGSTLRRQAEFSHLYNTANIDAIAAAPRFDLTVCAAAPGSMFEANRAPEQDHARIQSLIARLDQVHTRRFVLISSIAVLADFAAGYDEAAAVFQADVAYGRHRREVERFCASRFETCLIVRLPALFGPGLRKNFIFDLLNPVPTLMPQTRLDELKRSLTSSMGSRLAALYAPGGAAGLLQLDRGALNADGDRASLEHAVTAAGFSAVGFHNPATTYQYYDMTRLWADIGRAMNAGLREIHFATEPLRAARIHERLLGRRMPETGARIHREDMHTRHAELWGRSGPYLADAGIVLSELADFFAAERGGA